MGDGFECEVLAALRLVLEKAFAPDILPTARCSPIFFVLVLLPSAWSQSPPSGVRSESASKRKFRPSANAAKRWHCVKQPPYVSLRRDLGQANAFGGVTLKPSSGS